LSAGLRRALEGTAPVVGVGRILTPAMAEAALVRGDCDLVGVTRGQIADPDFLAKLRAGSATRIRRCVGANECADAVLAGSRLSCIHNPNVGRESMPPSRRSTRSRRLLVIGAGPAGLKAAELAAREGHRVTIADAAGEPGGLLRHIRVTAARELYAIVDWLRDELDAAEVELKLDTPVDAGFLRAHRPEAVILATGRQLDPLRPPAPAPGTPPVLCSFQALYEDIGHRVLVVDRAGDMEAALVAEALVTRGVSVVIATSLETFAPRAGYMMRRDLMPLLRNAGSEILVDTDIQTPLTESVTVVNRRDRSCREIPADAVVLVDVPKPDRTLEPVLRELAIPFHAVGDALTPRGIGAGMRDADRVVRSLG
jgi:thioredoxin reductase